MSSHRPRRSTVIAVIACVALVVVGTDYVSLAATGKSVLLGMKNTAGKTTVIKNKRNGPALGLKTKADTPPMKVSSSAKVVHLNADLLDGKGAAELGTRTQVLTATGTFGAMTRFVVPSLTPGVYLASYSVWLVGATGTVAAPESVLCYLQQRTQNSEHHIAPSSTVSTQHNPAVSGSGTIELGPDRVTRLVCETSGVTTSWTANALWPVELVLTSIDSFAEDPLTVGAPGPRGGVPSP